MIMKIKRKIIALGGLVLTILIVITACNKNKGSRSNSSSGSYYEQKINLEDQERENPTAFLKSDGTYRKNLLGEFVLEGWIKNTATVATFKDIVLEVGFYSKTGSLINTTKETVYEFVGPGKKKSFKLKVYGPKGTKSVGWEIIGAKAE